MLKYVGMRLFKNFYPYDYMDCIFDIDYEKLYKLGYRGIIFDIDNTIVPHGKASTPKVDAFFEHLHNIGYKTFLLSDNGADRIEMFIKNIDTAYIDNADKPKPKNFLKAVDLLGLDKAQVFYVGDQVFKDIYGANKSGIASILVRFVGWQTETDIGIRRKIENIVLKTYKRDKKYTHRFGDIQVKENTICLKEEGATFAN